MSVNRVATAGLQRLDQSCHGWGRMSKFITDSLKQNSAPGASDSPAPAQGERKGKESCSVMSDSFVTPWTVAYQASQSMGFSRQEYWSGLPLPSPGDLPDPGIEPGSPIL